MEQKTNLQKSWDEMSPHYQKKYGKSLMFYEKTIHLKLFGDIKGKNFLILVVAAVRLPFSLPSKEP